ncbi:MAG: hypothetical protein HKN21_07765 [Candidatus Eisenbacteria bacterium]|uniref:Glycosyl hydrolase family 13 catalytic domain-containing protein n=1 Tax=Eiseniibacteriota bacterium TaxID=2212470 RepID=A0A7Y2E912_UNCEI|nr:hypothetical protein [Candidatus Eisenbacteria bacterium]
MRTLHQPLLSRAVFLVLALSGLALLGATSLAEAAPVTFRFQPDSGAQRVTVAGSFNGWNMDANPLTDDNKDGVWEATIEIPSGEHHYKFVVNGSQWLTDESAASFVDDGFGGKNSVVNVGTEALTVGSGSAAASSSESSVETPAPTSSGSTSVTFRYQPVIGGIDSVHLAGSMNDWSTTSHPLADEDQDGIWEIQLDLPQGEHQYKFVVNGSEWFADDFAVASADDGLGGANSVIKVGSSPLVSGPGGNLAAVEENAAEETVGLRQVKFSHKMNSKPGDISVAGTFNDWTVGKSPLTDPDGDGVYETTVLLAPGDYQYKFVIDGNWTTDREGADDFADDGFGGQNSIIRVDDRFSTIDIGQNDGRMFTEGVGHEQSSGELNNLGNGAVQFTFRAHRNDVTGMGIHVSDEGGGSTSLAADPTNVDGVYQTYSVTVTKNPPRPFKYLAYYQDGDEVFHLSKTGFSKERPAKDAWFEFSEEKFPPFITPEWVKNAVIYQIFPDRFKNGNTGNDQNFSEWYYDGKNELPASGKTNEEYYHFVDDWYDVAGLSTSPYRTDGKPDYFSFYGGDIQGIHESLDYLEDLGVNAIYFNPLFEAKSNHKYDCCTYLEIDPHFGTNEEFKAFVDEAHSRGMRIILDIVFNHTGKCHYAFQDAVKKGPDSEYYDWYEFKQWPLPSGSFKADDYYYCWWGFGDLPDLNFDTKKIAPNENDAKSLADATPNEPLIDHLMDVVQLWIGDMDCDGVRLDVANEVPFWFWKEFNKKVKSIKPDAYIVGELWGNAGEWIGPDLYDATMNYAYFRDPVTKFLGQGNGTATEFDRALAAGRNTYPVQSVQTMMNLVGSHDTVRYLTQIGNDPNRVKLTHTFGFTYLGAPHIYYGDEIGMTGGKDPDCRRPFLWNYEQDPQRVDLRNHIKKLAKIRSEHKALTHGTFNALGHSGKVYTYIRSYQGESLMVVLNGGKTQGRATFGSMGMATELLSGEQVEINGEMILAPSEGKIFLLESPQAVDGEE